MAELGWCVRVVKKLLDANHTKLLIEFLLLMLFVLFLAYAILTLLPLQSAESIFFHQSHEGHLLFVVNQEALLNVKFKL